MHFANIVEDHGLRQARHELSAIEARITKQRDALLLLTTQQLDCDRLDETLSRILEVAAATLSVARVSIWRYDDARTSIRCLDLFNSLDWSHASGMSLSAEDYPDYFLALAQETVVAADDAMRDPRTAEFGATYLRPQGIGSMMDVPLHLKGRTIGVLCHEHVGAVRRWTEDEKAFGVAVSNLVSLAFERCERLRVEEALALHSAALTAASHPIIITDRSGILVWVNAAFVTLTGYTPEEALGRNPRGLLKSGAHAKEFYEQMWNTILSGNIWRGEMTNRRKDGSTYLEEMTITPVRNTASGEITHFVGIKRDLTEQRSLEAQYMQAQKMEVVGRLAGGIAHDFNNLLTVINGTAELALAELPDDHPLRQDFENIQSSGLRAAGLTRQLLTFSRKQIVKPVPLVVAGVLTGFRNMLQRLIGEDIALTVDAAGSQGTVLADQGHLEQVVLNLAVNARDAMPRGGRLTIEAEDVALDNAFAKTHAGVAPGEFVKLTIRDTGEGMPPEVMSRIFEPFFTTKEPGKGTGLGLATVYAIVEQSGGTIWVSSQVGAGTAFTIYLPRIASPDSPRPSGSDVRPIGGRETILLVEDDQSVRDMTVAMLKSAGYTAFAVDRAMDALQAVIERKVTIDMIITDVVLPGMGGHDLATHVSSIDPAMPVLFTSGYTDDLLLAHGVRENRVHFISKPYLPRALCHKIREVLDAAARRRDN